MKKNSSNKDYKKVFAPESSAVGFFLSFAFVFYVRKIQE
jgi:hypothetical protein